MKIKILKFKLKFITKLKKFIKRTFNSPWHQWEGIDQNHHFLSEISKSSCKAIKTKLKKQKILLIKITKLPRLKNQQLNLFWQMLATLLKGNLTLIDALSLLRQQQPAWYFLSSFLKELSKGKSLHFSLKTYPQYFPLLTRQLIMIGENTGRLEEIIQYLSDYFTTRYHNRKSLLKSLSYPFFLMISLVVINLFFVLFVIPQIKLFFNNQPLPYLTQLIFNLNDHLKWFLPVAILLTIFLVFFYRDSFPIIRSIIKLQQKTQFAQILYLTTCSGIDIITAFKLLKPLFPKSTKVIYTLNQGFSLSESLKALELDPFFLQIVALGENTGDLANSFKSLFFWYNNETKRFFEHLILWIEPIMILIISFIVGILAVGIYLPIFQLGNMG